MERIDTPLSLDQLRTIALSRFGNMVKAVVDVEKKVMVLDADLHADQEKMLLEQGSKQRNLWGINLYPDMDGPEGLVEFDSMINVRPGQGNLSRSVQDPEIRAKILKIISDLIQNP